MELEVPLRRRYTVDMKNIRQQRNEKRIDAPGSRYGHDGVDALNAEAKESRRMRVDHGGDWEDFLHRKKPDAPDCIVSGDLG